MPAKKKAAMPIVAAFSELLREEDYGKITVGDIIARAHVGRATFYGLFKSKDDLLSELVNDICTHALDDDGTPLDDPLVPSRAYPQQPLGSSSGRTRPRSRRRLPRLRRLSPQDHHVTRSRNRPRRPRQAPPAPWTAASYYTT